MRYDFPRHLPSQRRLDSLKPGDVLARPSWDGFDTVILLLSCRGATLTWLDLVKGSVHTTKRYPTFEVPDYTLLSVTEGG